jgi:hypothetical protein
MDEDKKTEKTGFSFTRKSSKREEPKVMVEPPSKQMVTPTSLLPKEAYEEEDIEARDPNKSMLDSNPTMRIKHQNVVQQRAGGAKKYFKSR